MEDYESLFMIRLHAVSQVVPLQIFVHEGIFLDTHEEDMCTQSLTTEFGGEWI